MSEKFNQQIIPLNKKFIFAFEEIVIFKFYYQDDNKKTWRTSTGRNEGTNVSVSTTLLSKDKNFHRKKWGNKCLCINDSFVKRQKTQQSIKKHYDNPKRSIFEKKQQQEQWRRAEEGTSEEQPKDMRKYIKGFKWRVYSILPVCSFFWRIVVWKME